MSVSVADTANKAVMSSEALGLVSELVVPSGSWASPPCTQGLGRPSACLVGNREGKMFKALPTGQDIPPSHVDAGSAAAFPGASAAGDHPPPTPCFVSTISPFFKTIFILSSKRHNRHFCVNADMSHPLRSHFNIGVINQAKFKKAKCVWLDS